MPVDVTDEYIMIRQKDPGQYQDNSFRIITLDAAKGIRAIIGRPKGKTSTEVQSYLFRRDKGWNASKAQAWVDKHKGGHQSKEWKARAHGYEGDRDLVVEIRSQHFMLSELSPEEQGGQINLLEAADTGITLRPALVALGVSVDILDGDSLGDIGLAAVADE